MGRSSTSAGHALLDDPALVHEDEPVAHLPRELHLVRDDEHRHPVTGEIAHHDQHLADELRIERGGDLVEQHHVRVHHQRPRDRDPLLLAAGELVRVLARLLGQPDLLEQLPRARLGVRARRLPDPARGEREVVHHGQMREEVELLEDDPDSLARRRQIGALARDLLALEEDPAGVQGLEQVDATQQRALAAPARADDRQHLAPVDVEVDPAQDLVVTETLVDGLQPYDGLRRRRRDRALSCRRHS